MKNRLVISCFFLLSLLSCNNDEVNISKNAENFLNEVLDIMEENSINRNQINWTDFRNKVFEKVGSAQTIKQTYPGIQEALILLNDNHSFFIKPDGTSFSGNTSLNCQAEPISSPRIPENIGYVKVSGFSGEVNSEEAIAFAQEIQNQISTSDHADILGWIVDLRGNTGGNMWPMLAGIGPILGEGIAGYFIDPNNNQSSWGYSNGSSFNEGNVLTQLATPYQVMIPQAKVAILLDKATSSSGEAIAISFIGRENTKSFGTSTCGRSTANRRFNLSNKSMLLLTVSYMADRNQNLYGNPVNPDEEATELNIIEKAIDWIEN